jgi:hypothetical protein
MNLFCFRVRFSVLKITFYKLTYICGNLCEHPTTESCTSFANVEPRVCETNKARMGAADLSTGPLLGAVIKLRKASFNHLTPNGQFSGRTAPLTYRCCIFLFIQQIYVRIF